MHESVAATLEVTNTFGLHLRAASTLAQVARQFTSIITVEHGNQEVNARSVLGLAMLRVVHGTKLKIAIRGSDAAAAFEAIKLIFEQRFYEGEHLIDSTANQHGLDP